MSAIFWVAKLQPVAEGRERFVRSTPEGVGAFRDPPVFMQDGDEIVVEIEGIGRLANRVVRPAAGLTA